jgi:hypothetical protein
MEAPDPSPLEDLRALREHLYWIRHVTEENKIAYLMAIRDLAERMLDELGD